MNAPCKKADVFKHHSGGVIHVQYKSHFGIVPEALLKDTKLKPVARLIAVWLTIMPPDWIIVPPVIQNELGITKGQWLKAAQQLIELGYLTRQRKQIADGEWLWDFRFCSDPTYLASTMVANSNHGAAVHGNPVDGGAGDAKPCHKAVPPNAVPLKHNQETTTTSGNAVMMVDSNELGLLTPATPNPVNEEEETLLPWIVDTYHRICTSLEPISGGYPTLPIDTRKNLADRAREHPEHDLWEKFFTRVQKSSYLCGEVATENAFKANIHWLMKDQNFRRVREGRYASGKKAHSLFGPATEAREFDKPLTYVPRLR